MKSRLSRKQRKRQSQKQKRNYRRHRKTLRQRRSRQRGGDLPVPNGAVIGLTMRSDKIDDPDAIPILVRKEEFEVEED